MLRARASYSQNSRSAARAATNPSRGISPIRKSPARSQERRREAQVSDHGLPGVARSSAEDACDDRGITAQPLGTNLAKERGHRNSEGEASSTFSAVFPGQSAR